MTTLTAANTFTAPELIPGGRGWDFSVRTITAFVGTITQQISVDQGVTWIDMNTMTADGYKFDKAANAVYVRAGFKALDWTSGSAEVGCS